MPKQTNQEQLKELNKLLRKKKAEFDDAENELMYWDYKVSNIDNEIVELKGKIKSLKATIKKK